MLKKQFRLTSIDHQSLGNSDRKTYFEMIKNNFQRNKKKLSKNIFFGKKQKKIRKKQKQIFRKNWNFHRIFRSCWHVSAHFPSKCVSVWVDLFNASVTRRNKKKQFQPWWKKSIKRKNNWKFHPEIIPILSYSVWTYCNEFKIKNSALLVCVSV